MERSQYRCHCAWAVSSLPGGLNRSLPKHRASEVHLLLCDVMDPSQKNSVGIDPSLLVLFLCHPEEVDFCPGHYFSFLGLPVLFDCFAVGEDSFAVVVVIAASVEAPIESMGSQ